jgi:hypothetical protein
VPITTQNRGSDYEVELPRVRFLREQSYANVQGLQAIQYHEMEGPVGGFTTPTPPAHPAPLARGIANALPSLPSPPQGWRSRAAWRVALPVRGGAESTKNSRPAVRSGREKLASGGGVGREKTRVRAWVFLGVGEAK